MPDTSTVFIVCCQIDFRYENPKRWVESVHIGRGSAESRVRLLREWVIRHDDVVEYFKDHLYEFEGDWPPTLSEDPGEVPDADLLGALYGLADATSIEYWLDSWAFFDVKNPTVVQQLALAVLKGEPVQAFIDSVIRLLEEGGVESVLTHADTPVQSSLEVE